VNEQFEHADDHLPIRSAVGKRDFTFSVFGTTNPAAPFTWSLFGNPVEVTPGVFQFTDSQAPNQARAFYRVQSP
jgi:hypothetical protein